MVTGTQIVEPTPGGGDGSHFSGHDHPYLPVTLTWWIISGLWSKGCFKRAAGKDIITKWSVSMSKKTSRRKVRKNIGTATVAPAMVSAPGKSYEFTPDYSYVIKDLRRIGMLAGTFVAVLLILALFLR